MSMNWREKFREDNRMLLQLTGGWRGKGYLIIAACTLARQTLPRLTACDGFPLCVVSFVKGAIWSLIWPFYWINYATNFVLLRPHG
jgi:hypothetical protein